MPELPEVETTARLLRPDLVGRRVRGAEVSWARTLGGQDPSELEEAVRGARIASVGRRAKFVLIELERRARPAGTIVCHLRMTGRLLVRVGRSRAAALGAGAFDVGSRHAAVRGCAQVRPLQLARGRE